MNKPFFMEPNPEEAPEWMAALNRWVLWKAELRDGSWTKVPYRVGDRGKASSTDPETWASFGDVVDAYAANPDEYDGIGFMLGDGYSGVDIDHVYVEGSLDPQAEAVLTLFDGCYQEKSPSGDGYHIVFQTDYDNPGHVKKNKPFEFYTEKRYLTFTGCVVSSDTPERVFVGAETVAKFYNSYMAKEADGGKGAGVSQDYVPDPEVSNLTDEELLALMFEIFPPSKQLFEGDISAHGDDDSRADLALCGYLVKICHADVGRVDALFRKSKLYRRKWDELRGEQTYGQMTIKKALVGYDPAKAPRLDLMGVDRGLLKLFHEANLNGGRINDKMFGHLFAIRYRSVLAYVPEAKSMYAYDGVRWIKHGAEQQAERMVKRFVEAATTYCAKLKDDEKRADALKKMARYQQYRARRNVLEDAKSELVRHLSDFDQDPHLLNALNKTIDLSGDGVVVRDHDPADLITFVAPVEYVEDATCELFENTLAACCEGDVELYEYIQKLFGKVVASDTSDDAFYLFGEQRRSGKGTVTSPLVEMLGSGEGGYAKNAQPETFAAKRRRDASASSGDRARLRNSKLILTSETPKGMELDATIMKEMTGDDLVTARYNYGDDEQFRMRGIIFMLANNFPTINDPSVFGSDRVKVIPFERFVPKQERDKTLRDRLREPGELSGLLNWCIEGIHKYRKEGFDAPEAVVASTKAYEKRCDMVAVYMEERLLSVECGLLKASEIYSDYCNWANETRRSAIGRNDFYERVRQRVRWRNRATIAGRSERNVIEGYALAVGDD